MVACCGEWSQSVGGPASMAVGLMGLSGSWSRACTSTAILETCTLLLPTVSPHPHADRRTPSLTLYRRRGRLVSNWRSCRQAESSDIAGHHLDWLQLGGERQLACVRQTARQQTRRPRGGHRCRHRPRLVKAGKQSLVRPVLHCTEPDRLHCRPCSRRRAASQVKHISDSKSPRDPRATLPVSGFSRRRTRLRIARSARGAIRVGLEVHVRSSLLTDFAWQASDTWNCSRPLTADGRFPSSLRERLSE
jgi:hypothetical protein